MNDEQQNNNNIKFLSADLPVDPQLEIRTPQELNISASEEDLKNLNRSLNKLLDVDNLIILAGSGTSLTFNSPEGDYVAPSMWHLWEACRLDNEETFNSILDKVSYENRQPIKNDDSSAKADIELLLSICDSMLSLGNLQADDQTQIENFTNRAKEIILEKTAFTESVESEKWATHNKLFRALARRSSQQQRLKIFTTNYDLAFETTASNNGYVVIDGFEFSSPAHFNPMWFNYDIVNRTGYDGKEKAFIPNVLHLYKMHGSVDWRNVDGKIRKTGTESTVGTPVFIYPSSAKYQTSYDTPYLDMMSAFLNHVQKDKVAVLCLGFGFNDKHINNALTMALRTNPEIILMVATKDPFNENGSFNTSMRNTLVEAINAGDGRISIIDSTLDDFVEFLPNRRSKTPEEDLMKVFEKISVNNSQG